MFIVAFFLPSIILAQQQVKYTLKISLLLNTCNQFSFVNHSLPEYDIEAYNGSNYEVLVQVDYPLANKLQVYNLIIRNRWLYPKLGFGFTL